MSAWPDRRIQHLFGIELPIIQAPMAGANSSDMVVAVSEAGGLGSLPCAPEEGGIRSELAIIQERTSRPINLNFFCHRPPRIDAVREAAWRQRLEIYFRELGLDPSASIPSLSRTPFDSVGCDLVVEFKPEVVSFHFGLPDKKLLARVRAKGAQDYIVGNLRRRGAMVRERRLRRNLLPKATKPVGIKACSPPKTSPTQVGTMALVPQVMEIGIEPTVRQGSDLGYIPVVVKDACGFGHRDAAERSIASLEFSGDALLTTVDAICAQLRLKGCYVQKAVDDLGVRITASAFWGSGLIDIATGSGRSEPSGNGPGLKIGRCHNGPLEESKVSLRQLRPATSVTSLSPSFGLKFAPVTSYSAHAETPQLEEFHEEAVNDKRGVRASTGRNDGVGNSDDGSDVCSDCELQGDGSDQHGGRLHQQRLYEYRGYASGDLPRHI
ncbi:MAG: 2-nitropropane dioxygenase [Acidobacteriaceae bacterium]|nr:2-nitropropane dioxygenase [Acidobacteriaceae bacterium]